MTQDLFSALKKAYERFNNEIVEPNPYDDTVHASLEDDNQDMQDFNDALQRWKKNHDDECKALQTEIHTKNQLDDLINSLSKGRKLLREYEEAFRFCLAFKSMNNAEPMRILEGNDGKGTDTMNSSFLYIRNIVGDCLFKMNKVDADTNNDSKTLLMKKILFPSLQYYGNELRFMKQLLNEYAFPKRMFSRHHYKKEMRLFLSQHGHIDDLDQFRDEFQQFLKDLSKKHHHINMNGMLALICRVLDNQEKNNQFSVALGLPVKRETKLFNVLKIKKGSPDLDERANEILNAYIALKKSKHSSLLRRYKLKNASQDPLSAEECWKLLTSFVDENQKTIGRRSKLPLMLEVLKDLVNQKQVQSGVNHQKHTSAHVTQSMFSYVEPPNPVGAESDSLGANLKR